MLWHFKITTGNSTLAAHLKSKHDLTPKDTVPVAKRSRTIADYLQVEPLHEEQMAVTWATCGLSYGLVEEPSFKQFFGSANPENGMHRHKMSVVMKKLADKYDQCVNQRVKGRPVTLCFDGWTNHGDKINNDVIIVEGRAFYLTSILLKKSVNRFKPVRTEKNRSEPNRTGHNRFG